MTGLLKNATSTAVILSSSFLLLLGYQNCSKSSKELLSSQSVDTSSLDTTIQKIQFDSTAPFASCLSECIKTAAFDINLETGQVSLGSTWANSTSSTIAASFSLNASALAQIKTLISLLQIETRNIPFCSTCHITADSGDTSHMFFFSDGSKIRVFEDSWLTAQIYGTVYVYQAGYMELFCALRDRVLAAPVGITQDKLKQILSLALGHNVSTMTCVSP